MVMKLYYHQVFFKIINNNFYDNFNKFLDKVALVVTNPPIEEHLSELKQSTPEIVLQQPSGYRYKRDNKYGNLI